LLKGLLLTVTNGVFPIIAITDPFLHLLSG